MGIITAPPSYYPRTDPGNKGPMRMPENDPYAAIRELIEIFKQVMAAPCADRAKAFRDFCAGAPRCEPQPKCDPPPKCDPCPKDPCPPVDMGPCIPPEVGKCFPGAKTFDVWFEHKDGQKAKQRSPIVLDLNKNGRPDLTGDVKLENGRYVAKGGGKVDFDIDPTQRSWKTKSIARRPGRGAPKVENGYVQVYDGNGKLIGDHVPLKDAMKGPLKGGNRGIQEGRAEVYDANGQLAGEYKKDEKSGKFMYHFGGRKDAEKTEWMAPGGGDALLAWDVDGNGKIDSSKELFGEFDVDGSKAFANGYEKLAKYFDANGDGKVDGDELRVASEKGVRVWKDVNGDAKTDAGELVTLAEAGVHALGTTVDPSDMSSTFE